ncbi:hypothetical protein [Rhodopirellula sp. MGV]|uniref:hypothetical protein n=1 Tax=Rhodopirellula sp. MGV TaxID=2023130 RepID=UPI0011799D30|nr:hypothetical protein [Rhodopirellula sp. MGV]
MTIRNVFDRAVEADTLLPVAEAEELLPEWEVRKMLERAAGGGSIIFDGESRVAQIQPEMFRYGDRSLDGLTLHTVGDGKGSMTFQLPIGTRIKSIAFLEDALEVTVFGELDFHGDVLSIPEQAPEVYQLTWLKGDPPPYNTLDKAIETRMRKK